MRLAGKRIVICEDNVDLRDALVDFVKDAGVEVVATAADGVSAVSTVLEHSPDLVLMDVAMPGMDGLKAARRILEQRTVCIVFMTAHMRFTPEFTELGAEFVSKPFDPASLIEKLERALDKRRPLLRAVPPPQ